MAGEMGVSTEPEAKDKVPFGRTGFFRDGIRRIDLILVVKDDGFQKREQLIINFLTNALKFGLCLELEPGLMVFHRNLVFVKIHAPESIIEEYGRKFEVRRYFKQNHVEFVNPKGIIRRLVGYIDYTGLYEREWIKLVRRKYPNPKRYSTIERSIIVHKLLLKLPFGDQENYVGFNRLLQGGIVVDAFPLHDGPYFAVPGQFPSEYNARQILNYNWAGLGNLLKLQPLNLIHEYFGDRMAMFFAFYGFYTISLIIPAIISTNSMLPDILITNRSLPNMRRYRQYNHTLLCPLCAHFEACRMFRGYHYETAMIYSRLFDTEDIDVILVYIVIWATLFVLFWRRREYYWMWMWECKPEIPAHAIREEYIPDKQELQGKDNGILYIILKTITTLLIGFFTIGCYLFLWILFAVGLMLLQEELIIYFNPIFGFERGYAHYKVPLIFYSIYLVIIIVSEKVWCLVSYTLTDLQNHRTDCDYESSLVLKLFGFSYPFTCTLFLYLAFFKQQFFTHPLDPVMYDYGGILMTQCNTNGCSDELALSLFFIIITKDCFFRLISHVHALFFMRTDYNQGKSVNVNVPCWEREYTLTPVTEKFMHDKFKCLAMQFGLSVGFVCGCPLTVFFITCVNILDIRITARSLVKGCRRPLLQNNMGIGSWKNVFVILIFATIIINSLIHSVTTSRFREDDGDQIYYRRAIIMKHVPLQFSLPKHIKKIFNSMVQKKVPFIYEKEFCGFPRTNNKIFVDKNYVNTRYGFHERPYITWYRRAVKTGYFTKEVSLIALSVIILFHCIPPRQCNIEKTKGIEKIIVEGN